MSATDRAVAAFDPISLEAANAAAELQTRVDRKYLVVEPALIGLLAGVGSTVRVLHCDGERAIAYRSTYFDTADFALFRAAAQGRRQRFKVRSRTYGERGPSVLEVKARGIRGTTVKSRIDYTHQDRDTVTPDGRQFVAAVTGRPDLAAALRPALSTAFHRTTLLTRATFSGFGRSFLVCAGQRAACGVGDTLIAWVGSAHGVRAEGQDGLGCHRGPARGAGRRAGSGHRAPRVGAHRR